MKKSLFILIFLSSINLIAQNNFIKMPEKATEIHFVYEIKSNYFVDKNGIYADSLLFTIDFPRMKTEKKRSPLDSTKYCNFISFKDIKKDDKKFLVSKIYHTNETIYATHYLQTKMTEFHVKRWDESTKQIFKKYFLEHYDKFEFTQEFDYNQRTEKRKFPIVNYDIHFQETEKTITFKEPLLGSYKENSENVLYENIVYLNENLSKYITPKIFTNNTFGIEKIETINETITLKSVSYK